uniref:Uncharacterized protein n=1 Tax=Rhizophora mucronata TaxID=61149 RepID=A0A2P2PKZ5_RHIMU
MAPQIPLSFTGASSKINLAVSTSPSLANPEIISVHDTARGEGISSNTCFADFMLLSPLYIKIKELPTTVLSTKPNFKQHPCTISPRKQDSNFAQAFNTYGKV